MLDLTDVIDRLSLRVAPEFGEVTKEVIDRYPNIKAWLAARIEKSDFAGEVNMRLKEKLCPNCPNADNSAKGSQADSDKNQKEESK